MRKRGKPATPASYQPVHGESGKTRLHNIWKKMRQRVNPTNASNPRYHNYAGRGITICPEWSEYLIFREWALSNGYSDDLTIDRIDNDGNYEPENCRWATIKTQSNNTSVNRRIRMWGETKSLKEWTEDPRVPATYDAALQRLQSGMSEEKALLDKNVLPVVTAFGETKSVMEWSRDPRCKVVYSALSARLRRGWNAERSMSTESRPKRKS